MRSIDHWQPDQTPFLECFWNFNDFVLFFPVWTDKQNVGFVSIILVTFNRGKRKTFLLESCCRQVISPQILCVFVFAFPFERKSIKDHFECWQNKTLESTEVSTLFHFLRQLFNLESNWNNRANKTRPTRLISNWFWLPTNPLPLFF